MPQTTATRKPATEKKMNNIAKIGGNSWIYDHECNYLNWMYSGNAFHIFFSSFPFADETEVNIVICRKKETENDIK